MCGSVGDFVGKAADTLDSAPQQAGVSAGKSSSDLVGNAAGNMAFVTPDSTVGKASALAGAGVLAAAPEAAGAVGGTAAEGASGSAAAAAGGESAAAASGESEAALGGVEGVGGGTGVSPAATGSDVLGTIKTLAPTIAAGANLLAAGAALTQAQAAGDQAAETKPNVAPDKPQAPSDPDVAALRKKNTLLFSDSATDITKGNADTGNLGRTTLLGGSTKLGG